VNGPFYFSRMSLAQFSDVHFGYPGNDILESASLLIRPGERLAPAGTQWHREDDGVEAAGGRADP
jgi:hypothetical protein